MAGRWLPSKARVRQLKTAGVFSWSSLATRSSMVAVVLGAVCVGPKVFELLSDYDATSASGLDGLPETLGLFVRTGSVFVVSTAALALFAGIVVSLLQTGGVFTWAALRAVRRRERLKNPLVSLIGLVLAFNAACCLVYAAVPKLFSALGTSDRQPIAAQVTEILYGITKLVVVASVVLAVVLVFVSRLFFLLRLRKRARQAAGDEA